MNKIIAVAAFIFALLASTGLAATPDKVLERLMPAASDNGRGRMTYLSHILGDLPPEFSSILN